MRMTGQKPTSRGLHTRVKTARGRKNSSTRWLQRQLNDPYVVQAKADGFRSRSAYKLLELDEKFRLLTPKALVVDLGAAPGGWLQVAQATIQSDPDAPSIIGIDLLPIDPVAGTLALQGDFSTEEGLLLVTDALGGRTVDVVLSDMAPNATGHQSTDHIRIIALVELAAEFAFNTLTPGGHFVAKVWQGGAESELLQQLKKRFEKVKHAKPKSSRADSAETYLVAMGFKG